MLVLSIIFLSLTSIDALIDKNGFALDALQAHNDLRTTYGVPPLKLNSDISKIAQAYAEKLANTNYFAPSTNTYLGRPLGENLAQSFGFTPYGGKINVLF